MSDEQSNGAPDSVPTDFVLDIRNHHSADSGPPPGISAGSGSGTYVGYFENSFGEQWVLQIDQQQKIGTLRGGDIGWDTEIRVAGNHIEDDVILAAEEFAWLAACWRAATGESLRGPSHL